MSLWAGTQNPAGAHVGNVPGQLCAGGSSVVTTSFARDAIGYAGPRGERTVVKLNLCVGFRGALVLALLQYILQNRRRRAYREAEMSEDKGCHIDSE